MRRALRTPQQLLRRTADTAHGLVALAGALVPVGVSSLSGPVGRPRRYRVARASLADVKAVHRQLGGTVNDVFLAAIAGAFRKLLLGRGEQPGRHVIRSLVPVSVRAPGEERVYDNRVSLLLADLSVDVADPVERLAATSAHLAALKASKEAEAGEALTSIARYEPFPLVSLGVRLLFRLPQPTSSRSPPTSPAHPGRCTRWAAGWWRSCRTCRSRPRSGLAWRSSPTAARSPSGSPVTATTPPTSTCSPAATSSCPLGAGASGTAVTVPLPYVGHA